MIYTYDPEVAPDPKAWLKLDEGERIVHILNYHESEDKPFEEGGLQVHCVVHAIVENQIALGDDYPVKESLNRLMQEGLSRHDSIHAIGSILIKYMWGVGTGEITSGDFSDDYFQEVKELTAQKWLDEFE